MTFIILLKEHEMDVQISLTYEYIGIVKNDLGDKVAKFAGILVYNNSILWTPY
jgi:hypothetical protein